MMYDLLALQSIHFLLHFYTSFQIYNEYAHMNPYPEYFSETIPVFLFERLHCCYL